MWDIHALSNSQNLDKTNCLIVDSFANSKNLSLKTEMKLSGEQMSGEQLSGEQLSGEQLSGEQLSH